LFIPLSRLFLDKTAAIIAIALFSFARSTIFYSTDFKQYSLELLFSVAILLVSISTIRNLDKRTNFILLFFLGVISLWFSHTSVFLLGGIFLILLFSTFRRHRQSGWLMFGTVCIIIAFSIASMMLYYVIFLKTATHNINLYTEWKPDFAPFPIKNFKDFFWYPNKILEITRNPISLYFSGLVIISFFSGLLNFFRTRRFEECAILLSPIILLMVASVIQFYPIAPRLILFLIPIFYIVIAEGVTLLYRLLYQNHQSIGIAFLLLILAYPVATVTSKTVRPDYFQEVRPSVEYLVKHLEKNDGIYLYNYSVSVFQFYTRDYQIEYIKGIGTFDKQIYNNIYGDQLQNLFLKDIDRFKGKSRVWFMFSNVLTKPLGINEESLCKLYLDLYGKKLDEFHRPGASLYLYDLSVSSLF
jgi:hypothetical protein